MKYCIIVCILLLVQCTEEEYPTFEVPTWEPVPESFATQIPAWKSEVGTTSDTAPDWFLNLKEDDALPDWVAPDQNLYPGSMTAIIRLTPYLERNLADKDQIAAIIGDVCHGVGLPTNIDGVNYFFIQIKAASDEQDDITFKYYSNSNNKLYTSAEKVPYRIDKIYGTSQSPIYPDFESSGKYPYYMNAFLQPDLQIVPFEVRENDRIAAFVGNECRGSVSLSSGNKILNLEIRGKAAGEPVVLKYYSHATKMIYQVEEKFNIEHKAQKGTEIAPVKFGVMSEAGMIAYVSIPEILSSYTSDNDIVAAFVEDECRGVFSHRLSVNGKSVFRIPVRINLNEKATFRYYNSTLEYIFTTGNNSLQSSTSTFGSATIPKVLPLITDECHPLRMTAVFEISDDLVKDISQNDKLAAFVNDECRGIGKFIESNGKKIFKVEINGSIGLKEKVSIKYYNASVKYQYESAKSFDFVHESSFGSIAAPESIELKVIKN